MLAATMQFGHREKACGAQEWNAHPGSCPGCTAAHSTWTRPRGCRGSRRRLRLPPWLPCQARTGTEPSSMSRVTAWTRRTQQGVARGLHHCSEARAAHRKVSRQGQGHARKAVHQRSTGGALEFSVVHEVGQASHQLPWPMKLGNHSMNPTLLQSCFSSGQACASFLGRGRQCDTVFETSSMCVHTLHSTEYGLEPSWPAQRLLYANSGQLVHRAALGWPH